ncbi:MAG: malto-oligosyltrehalose synthase, partial [Acidimicrobiales bacterium]
RQHYRLAFWRLGSRQGNYRRFFDIDTLVGVRMHDPAVYHRTHWFILDLLSDQRIAGVRVDHIDGLADPAGYLRQLRTDIRAARAGEVADGALLVEKIMARGEELAACWPVDGTTGYEFADLAVGLFLRPPAADPNVASSAIAAKREVLATLFAGEVNRLVRRIMVLADSEEPGLDLDAEDMRQALVEISAQLDVYRTYLDGGAPSSGDRGRITKAAARSAAGLGFEAGRALQFFTRGLLAAPDIRSQPIAAGWIDVAQRWQQLTGASAAKGVEDTAVYRADQCLAAADVGGELTAPEVSPGSFHSAMADRGRRHPHTLNTTSTHDSKRSEDVRTRLAVLTEWSGPWAEQVARWQVRHRHLLASGDAASGASAAGSGAGGGAHVHPHDESLFYQTVVGAWPRDPARRTGFTDRIAGYLIKAAREAKVRTSWSDPDDGYESMLGSFVAGTLGADDSRFVSDVDSVVDAIGPAATVNGLGLITLKLTVPGIPDIYQGSEAESLNLTDPDNRRPVDFERLAASLAALECDLDPDGRMAEGRAASLLDPWWDGRAKLYVTHRLLTLRRSEPSLFDQSRYLPLRVRGIHHDHVIAFARAAGNRWSVTLVPRLSFSLAGLGKMPIGLEMWADTTVVLPADVPDELGNVFTGGSFRSSGGELSLGQVLGTFPVAVLTA